MAAQRAQKAKARALNALSAGPSGQIQDERPSSTDHVGGISEGPVSTGHVQVRDYESSLQQPLGGENVPMPSTQVALELIELFFSRHYHANLLFHKQTFISSYIAGDLPDFVLLSVFCLAAM